MWPHLESQIINAGQVFFKYMDEILVKKKVRSERIQRVLFESKLINIGTVSFQCSSLKAVILLNCIPFNVVSWKIRNGVTCCV